MVSILNAAEGAVVESSKMQVLLMNILPFVFIFVIFYFLLIRPQKKKQQEHILMVNNLKSGDKILLSSGIIGVVKSLKEDRLVIEISNNVEIEVMKTFVANIIK